MGNDNTTKKEYIEEIAQLLERTISLTIEEKESLRSQLPSFNPVVWWRELHKK